MLRNVLLVVIFNKKAEAPWSAAYGLLERANALSSCDAYAAEGFLMERSN